jgi:hypothetical protein
MLPKPDCRKKTSACSLGRRYGTAAIAGFEAPISLICTTKPHVDIRSSLFSVLFSLFFKLINYYGVIEMSYNDSYDCIMGYMLVSDWHNGT